MFNLFKICLHTLTSTSEKKKKNLFSLFPLKCLAPSLMDPVDQNISRLLSTHLKQELIQNEERAAGGM
jgi:hypothetical protein